MKDLPGRLVETKFFNELVERKAVTNILLRLVADKILAVSLMTNAAFVGMSSFQAPLGAYIATASTGFLFGVLVLLRGHHGNKEDPP